MDDVIRILISTRTLAAAVRMLTPIALAALGGTLSERTGVVNIGLEGMMLVGAFGGALGSYLTGNPWLGVILALIFGAIFGLIFAVLTIEFKADQTVTGAGINVLALGVTTWLLQVIWGTRGTSPSVTGFARISMPLIRDIPVIGEIFGYHSPLVYLMFVIMILGWIMLFKHPFGLRLRMVGEHPEAADTLGIEFKKYRYFGVVMSGVLSSLGGAYLSLGHLNWFSRNMSAGRGFIAIAANIFGRWNPIGGLGASFLFAYTDALQMRLQTIGIAIDSEIIQMLPYLLTVIVITGAVTKARAPEGLKSKYEPNQ